MWSVASTCGPSHRKLFLLSCLPVMAGSGCFSVSQTLNGHVVVEWMRLLACSCCGPFYSPVMMPVGYCWDWQGNDNISPVPVHTKNNKNPSNGHPVDWEEQAANLKQVKAALSLIVPTQSGNLLFLFLKFDFIILLFVIVVQQLMQKYVWISECYW